MNWQRGFVRLWLVMSAGYVALVMTAVGPNTFTELYKPPAVYEVEFLSGTKQRFDMSKSRDALFIDIERAYRIDAAALGNSGKMDAKTITDLERDSNELLDHLGKKEQQRREKALNALIAAAVPPTILLMLGALFGWVAHGFRRSNAGT